MKPIGAPSSAQSTHNSSSTRAASFTIGSSPWMSASVRNVCVARTERSQISSSAFAVGRESLADRHGHADAPPEWTIPIRFPAGSSNRAKWTTPGTSVGGITTFPPAATT